VPPQTRFRIYIDASSRNGRVRGKVHVRDGREFPWGIETEDLHDPEEFDRIAERLREGGWFDKPEETLRAAINNQVQALEAEAGRDDPRPSPRSKHDVHARYYVRQLRGQGRFVRAIDAGFYFDNETRMPVNVQTDEMLGVLAAKFPELNEMMPVTKYVMSALKWLPRDSVEEVEVKRHSHYDAGKNELLVHIGEGRVLRIDGKGPPQIIDNGIEGVMFRPLDLEEPWTYKPDHETALRSKLIDRLNFSELEDCPFTMEEQRFLFLVWMLSFWFRSSMRSRPLIVAYGRPQYGKTMAMEHVGKLLIGLKFSTNPPPTKDDKTRIEVALVNRVFMVVDNLDSYVKWFQDLVSAIVTGSSLSERVLYENMKEGHYTVDVIIAITTFQPKHRRTDLASRSLFFLFQEFGEDEMEDPDQLTAEIVASRDDILSELADLANEVLAVPRVRQKVSFRMAGFNLFMLRVADGLDRRAEQGRGGRPSSGRSWREVVPAILTKQRAYQQQFTSEGDPLFLTLPLWLDKTDTPGGVLNAGRTVTTTELLKELSAVAREHEIPFDLKHPRSLTAHITTHRTLLETAFHIDGPLRGGGGGAARPGFRGGSVYRIWHADDPDKGNALL